MSIIKHIFIFQKKKIGNKDTWEQKHKDIRERDVA